MTPQEAIELFKRRIHVLKQTKKASKRSAIYALEMAIEALEKQIPKKPLITKMTYKDTGGERIITNCPHCRLNEKLGLWDSLIDRGTPYCRRCGQAIDWSDTE